MAKTLKGRSVRVRKGRWHYRFNWKGTEYSGPTGLEGTLENRTTAERFAEDERRRLQDEGALVKRGAPAPFDTTAGEFIAWCRDVEYRQTLSTAQRIDVSFRSAVEFFGATPVQELDDAAIERYKGHRLLDHGVRGITVRHDLHALSIFFQWAKKMGLAEANPIEDVTIPSDKDAVREHVITAAEDDAYFDAAFALHTKYAKSFKDAQPNLADLARLMLEQGARPEELLAARKEAYDARTGTLFIAGGKTRAARRTLNLTAASTIILDRRAALPGPWLFPSDRNPGQHLTKLACTHDRVCTEAGVSFVLYDFRHTFATRQIQDGNPVAVVAAIMGHSGLRTIHRYVHPTGEAQKKAMENYEAAQRRRKLKVVG